MADQTTTITKTPSSPKQIVEDFVKESEKFDLITVELHAKNLNVDLQLFKDLEKAAGKTIQRCLAYEKDQTTKPLLIELRSKLAGIKWKVIKGKSARIRIAKDIMTVSGKTRVNGLYLT